VTYDLCAECERPVRPKRALLTDHPGTVAPGGLGKCNSCYGREIRRRTRRRASVDRKPAHARAARLTHDETDDALCRQTDPELFFSPEGQGMAAEKASRIRSAKRICAACPIAARCLEVAYANGEEAGIWGGLTPEERGTRTPALRESERKERAAEVAA
jgi:WhiB family redox-sensing transcriptional regulator